MALVSLKGGLHFPAVNRMPFIGANEAGSFINGWALDGASKKVGNVFQMKESRTIRTVKLRCPVHTTGGDIDVRLETVSATDGNPTGTLVATNTNIVVATAGTGLITATLTADAALSAGTFYALVVAWVSGDRTIGAFGADRRMLSNKLRAYSRYHDGSNWLARGHASVLGNVPLFALMDDAGVYVQLSSVAALSADSKQSFNNTSGTRERGVALIPRVPMRVIGWYLHGQPFSADYNVVLANAAGTALLTFTGDKDLGNAYNTGTNYSSYASGYFSSTVNLSKDTTYYLTLVPTSASNVMLREGTILDTGDVNSINALPCQGDCKLVTRDSGGTYTVSDTVVPFGMGLIIDQLDDGTGGGGSGDTGGLNRFNAGFN